MAPETTSTAQELVHTIHGMLRSVEQPEVGTGLYGSA